MIKLKDLIVEKNYRLDKAEPNYSKVGRKVASRLHWWFKKYTASPKGYVEFLTEEPLFCKETKLTQVFSKPSELTGVIYELIKREDGKGFCEKNVEQLMESSR